MHIFGILNLKFVLVLLSCSIFELIHSFLPNLRHVTRSSHICTSLSNGSKFEFRNLQVSDINNVAAVCVDAFDDSIPWYQPLARMGRQKQQAEQLLIRYRDMIATGQKHAMVVCYNPVNDALAGFVEIGMLPNPIKSSPSNASNQTNSNTSMSSIFMELNEEYSSNTRPDVPYLGNVVVSKSYRRYDFLDKSINIVVLIVHV